MACFFVRVYTPLAVGNTMGHYFCDFQNFTNVTEQPKKYTPSNQTSIKSLFIGMSIHRWLLAKYMKKIYIHPWLLAWKYFGCRQNSKRMYIYIFGCRSTDRVGAGRAHQGHIYTSLAVGKNLPGMQRVKETFTLVQKFLKSII